MLFVGIDQGNRVCGLAVGVVNDLSAPPEVTSLRSVAMPGSDRADEGALRVLLAVRAHAREPSVVRIERPPDVVRRDVRHGPQARIGWALGYLAGRLSADLEHEGHSVAVVPVRTWRAEMMLASARWGGLPSPAPDPESRAAGQVRRAVRDPEGNLAVKWDGCGHVTPVNGLSELSRFAHLVCPACLSAGSVKKPPTKAEDRTERWKRLACELTARHWPTQYQALVADARDRARSGSKADHELSGVPDACEALWIGISALSALAGESSAQPKRRKRAKKA